MIKEDTIAAISTPLGIGGIGIIRISGNNSINIVDKVFYSKRNIKLTEVKSHTINYGYIVNSNGKIIDEVLVSVMREPNTFTKEDVVEINCHGGLISVKTILEEVLKSGARLAEPGEFSKRAFLNGRIDLTQAEAIIDIINSKTNIELDTAVNHLQGKLSAEINKVRDKLLDITAHLQAAVDFPEYDIEEIEEERLISLLNQVLERIDFLLSTADTGKVIREGLNTVIIGKPNVGKSSLLNALVKEKRAIVTEIPGTTRDTIEEYVNIKGIPLKIIDTAGIRETEELVERIGVEKSLEVLKKADLIILMLDGSKEVSKEDKIIIKAVKSKNTIALINKSDLKNIIDVDYIKSFFNNVINISVKEGTGLEKLEEKIVELFNSGEVKITDELIITNVRHKDSLEKARVNIVNSIKSLSEGVPVDIIGIDLFDCIENLGEIIGMTVSEEIVDKIFHNFCVGK